MHGNAGESTGFRWNTREIIENTGFSGKNRPARSPIKNSKFLMQICYFLASVGSPPKGSSFKNFCVNLFYSLWVYFQPFPGGLVETGIHGFPWKIQKSVGIHRFPWKCTQIHENPRISGGNARESTDLHWNLLEIHRNPRICIEIYWKSIGILRNPKDLNWTHMGAGWSLRLGLSAKVHVLGSFSISSIDSYYLVHESDIILHQQ